MWNLMEKRQPPIDCVLDQWTKPAVWEDIVYCKHIEFYLIDFKGPKQEDIPENKKVYHYFIIIIIVIINFYYFQGFP